MNSPMIGMTRIELKRMKLYSYHGVLAQERRVGNDYEVSVGVDYDSSSAVVTDSIKSAVNYAELAEIVRLEMAIPSNLLETVATRIATRICMEFNSVRGGYVSITKVMPPIGAAVDGVTVRITFNA